MTLSTQYKPVAQSVNSHIGPALDLEGSSLTLGLNQRHALKAFRASVGDEEGHCLPLGFWSEY